MIANKAKASVSVAKPNTLAVCLADVVEAVKPVPFARGFLHRIRGFESHRRLQLRASVEVAPSSEAEITTAEAIATRKPIMGLMAVDLKEIRRVQTRSH